MLCVYKQLFLRLLLTNNTSEGLMPELVGSMRSSWRLCDGIDASQQRFSSAIKVYLITADHFLSNKVIK